MCSFYMVAALLVFWISFVLLSFKDCDKPKGRHKLFEEHELVGLEMSSWLPTIKSKKQRSHPFQLVLGQWAQWSNYPLIMQPVLDIRIDLMTARCHAGFFFHFMDFILTWGYTVCYAAHQTWLQSQAWRTLLLPTYSAYSHSTYNSLTALLKRAKKDFTIMFLPLSPAKDSMFLELGWAEVQNKSRTIMAKSSLNVQKRQPGPVKHWAPKKRQEGNSSFSRSYRNVLFLTRPCLYDLQQTEHRGRCNFYHHSVANRNNMS